MPLNLHLYYLTDPCELYVDRHNPPLTHLDIRADTRWTIQRLKLFKLHEEIPQYCTYLTKEWVVMDFSLSPGNVGLFCGRVLCQVL